MTFEELEILIKEGEGLTVEFKEKYTPKIAEDIVAFANSKGGKILLGVSDNGKITGESLTGGLKAELLSLARNCHDSIKILFKQVEAVIVVEVPEGESKPYQCSSGYFKRYDAVTQKMLPSEVKSMFRNNLDVSYENILGIDFEVQAISFEKVRAFIREANYSIKITRKNIFEVLKSLNLTGKNKITNAGIMLFGKEVSSMILQCQITLVAYKDLEGIDVYDRQDIRDDLWTQYNEAVIFLKKHLNKGSIIKGVNRYDSYEIPLEAIREALTNAIIHRDYSISGTQITVAVYPDRVEISNPGSLPEGMSKINFGKLSVRRNEILADLFSRMNKGEKLGRGIIKIKSWIKAKGLKVKFESSMFFTTVFSRPVSSGRVMSNISEGLNEGLKSLYSEIIANPGIKAKQLSALLKERPIKTLERQIKTLTEKKFIERQGSKKTGGYRARK